MAGFAADRGLGSAAASTEALLVELFAAAFVVAVFVVALAVNFFAVAIVC